MKSSRTSARACGDSCATRWPTPSSRTEVISRVVSRRSGLILSALEEVSGLTRAELVRATGLSRTTVLGIVSELLDEGASHADLGG